jgi:flagellar basal-body rod protein FlgF
MLRGLYTAASGMNAEMLEQDVVANNIANSTTVGFKTDDPVFEAFPNRLLQRIHDRMDSPLGAAMGAGMPPAVAMSLPPMVLRNIPGQTVGWVGQGVKAAGTVTHFTGGSLSQTGQPLDLALEGPGLFTIQKADGSTAYTRAGNFTVNSDKQLCTMNGDLVMGNSGQPIVLTGKDVVIDTQGGVKVDGSSAGSLQLEAYDPSRFVKSGENLYVKVEADIEPPEVNSGPPSDVRVRQGYLEQSNVEVVTEMVHMISLMRAYEANTKTIYAQDESLNQLFTNVGTPSA